MNFDPIIITISSKYPREGKTTFAEILVDIINSKTHLLDKKYQPMLLNFSDEVKTDVVKLHNLDINKLLKDSEYKALHRPKLIEHGNKMRKLEPKYWLNRLIEYYTLHREFNKQPIIIIPDRRYFNEDFKNLKIKKLITIFIHTNLSILRKRVNNDEIFLSNLMLQYNESQREMKLDNYEFDYIISNNTTTKHLKVVGNAVLSEVLNYEI